MSPIDVVQLISLILCIGTVPLWLWLGWRNPRLRYLRWVVLIPTVATIGYYYLVLFVQLNKIDPFLTALLSALLRLYIVALFFIGGLAMTYLFWHRFKS